MSSKSAALLSFRYLYSGNLYYFCCTLLDYSSVVRHCPTPMGQLQAFTLPPTILWWLRLLNLQPLTPDLHLHLIPSRLIRVPLPPVNTKSISMSWKMQSCLSSLKPVLLQHKCSWPLKLRPMYAPAFVWASCCLWSQWQLCAVKPKGWLQQAAMVAFHMGNYWSRNPANTPTCEFSGTPHITCPSFLTTQVWKSQKVQGLR